LLLYINLQKAIFQLHATYIMYLNAYKPQLDAVPA